MPPRRTTRKASVQPESQASSVEPSTTTRKVSASKRKRAEPERPLYEEDEDDSLEKRSSRARKPASRQASTSVGKVSAASRKAPTPVDEENEDAVAAEPEDASSPPKRTKTSSPEQESDAEAQEDGAKASTSKSAKTTSKRVTARSTKARRVVVDDDDDDSPAQQDASDESFEEEKPKRKGRASKPPSRASSTGKARKPASRASTAPPKKAAVKREETIDEEDENSLSLDDAVDQATPRSSRVKDKSPSAESEVITVKKLDEESDDEPEQCLLDDHPITAKPKARASVAPPLTIPEEPQGPKSRLVIHKMVLVNFKSYAGRQVIGPFHKSFSAIVGPNGSGKSNTIDALLFVFGYRASKMRQGKLSELIHNSANYPDLDECSVEVHFREIIDLPGPDAFEVIPNSQIVVARHAYKSNASKYTINGRLSSFTEVTTLLKGRGIDLDHKRFLILQGEVESIAQMKPKAQNEHEDGLLEYLEDIIGTDRYKQPIEEALTELDNLGDVRSEKLNRLRIVEREKNALEEKKHEAEEFLRLQNEYVRAQSRLYQWYLWKCLEADQQYAETIENLEVELAEETDRNKDDIAHCQLLEENYEDRVKTYEEVKAAAIEAAKNLAIYEKQQVNLEERKKHANTKATKLKKSLKEDEKSRDEALRFIDTNAEKMVKEREKLTELEESLTQEEKVLERIRDSLKDKTQVFHDQIEVKQRELQPWTTQINAKQAEKDVAVSERDTLKKKAEAVTNARKEAQEGLEQLQNDHAAKETEKEELRNGKSQLQKELKAGEKRIQDLQRSISDLRAKAISARQKADEAKASQVASTSQNRVLDGLMRLKNSGRISGFHGRLGSLGTIPEKYDVAISTACPALNNLIVDTVDQGQACIEYLRKQNLGRASFIVLEKLSQTNGLEKIPTPENVPRLMDLIQPKEPRFAPAFFKAVGNTLVANDLEQANRIAYGQKRWRVVTLTGQLIDTSGTMSGGGTHVARGAMSSKLTADAVSPETLRKYDQDSEDAAGKLEVALAQLREFEASIDDLTRKVPEMDMSLQKIDLDIQTGVKRIAEAEKRVRELKSKSKPDEGDLARIVILDKEIASADAELEALKKKSGVVEKAIQDLEKKILEIGGSKLLSQKSKVDGIKLHINLAMDEITRAEVNKAKAEKDSERFAKAIETHTAALQEVDQELEELNAKLKEVNEFVTETQSKVDKAQAAADNAKDDLESLKAELDEKTEQIQQFRQREMEIKQHLNDAKKEAQENEKAIDHYRTEHDKLKLEEVDEEDEDEDEHEVVEQAQVEAASARASEEPMSEDQEGEKIVKPEPVEATIPPLKKRARTPSYELHIYSVEELSRFKKKELLADVSLLDEQIKNSSPNLAVLKEYRKREQEFLNRAKDLEEVTSQRDAAKAKYDGLRKQRLDEFMTGFNAISAKLKEMYQMITLGGNAELELVDSMDPFSEGIIFSVMPPKKSWKNISNLSGGEKTLSSLALVFALHVFKPTPLYFMDEIDAALDFRNVSIVANYIKDRTKNAQFIIISLRNDMFELSHRLIGIYKTSNATRSISINNHALNAVPHSQGREPMPSQAPGGMALTAPMSTSVSVMPISAASTIKARS
ncbi:SMC4 [Sanghuangporus vaninii]